MIMGRLFGLVVTICALPIASLSAYESHNNAALIKVADEIERRLGGHAGVMVHDTHSGRRFEHRADERFPLLSTFKPLACAWLLSHSEQGKINLDKKIPIQEADLVTYSPITKDRDTMTLAELCAATLATSDNTAANLILQETGGPAALTDFLRRLGDPFTRLDRYETALNEAAPGDPRDTTSPRAMVDTLEKLLTGKALAPASRQQLETWMTANRVSNAMLRSVLPEKWRIADRSGAGGNGSRAIIALIRPPERRPIVIAIYITGTEASLHELDAAIAEIGTLIFSALKSH